MFNRSKILAAYILAIPLALILGFLAASPDEMTFMLIGMLLFFLALPLFIQWHHALLIVFWNSAFCAFFLPGEPAFWLFFAALSFGLSVLNYIMGRRPFLPAPELNRPLLFLAAVVLGTACYRGGIGFKALGGTANGSKNYIYVMGAIVGYYALTAGQVPILKSRRMAGLFFLSGATYLLSNIAYTLGPDFFFLYNFVPSSTARGQAAVDLGLTSLDRISGLAQACIAALCFLLMNHGIRGLFDWTRPWRLVVLGVTFAASLFAGFRSVVVTLFLVFACQFYFERLWRTHLLPIFAGLVIFGLAPILLFSNRMPLAVQRAVSFLPVSVDSAVRADAAGSIDWRMQMWAIVVKDVPKYLLVGKGYAIDPTDMFLTGEAIRMGIFNSFEESMLAGDYHSGPLSVIIPFGICGAVAFLWVLVGGFRVLFLNYRYGDARLRQINTVLLSFYLANCISFFFIFGALNSELGVFLGVCGFSVSLNGGVRRKPKTEPEYERAFLPLAFELEPG